MDIPFEKVPALPPGVVMRLVGEQEGWGGLEASTCNRKTRRKSPDGLLGVGCCWFFGHANRREFSLLHLQWNKT